MQGYQQEPGFAQRTTPTGDLHKGVVSFMNGVYAWMAAGIGVSAAVAAGISMSPSTMLMLFGGPQMYIFIFAPFVLAIFLQMRIAKMEPGLALALFFVFSALSGVTLSVIPHIYTATSIVAVLASTVGLFAVMAIFGFVTKKDLTGVGQFLVMALIGAIIASFVNILLGSGMMSMIISVVVAIAAAGLTAYDTQALKQQYMMHGARGNLAVLGALLLYINFYNLFVSLLRLFGSRD
jgi:FtsH-binding integral membrane protein